MRVFVTGATGVLGGSAVAALVAEGHEVTGLARTDAKAASLRDAGATPCRVSLFDVENLTTALDGHDAVCNLATAIPVGTTALRPGAWRANDRLRIEGSQAVATAARNAGVRYNVAAEPVRRRRLARAFADAAGSEQTGFVPRWLVRLAGERLEPLTRSQRVSADKLHQATGWKALQDAFDSSWLHAGA